MARPFEGEDVHEIPDLGHDLIERLCDRLLDLAGPGPSSSRGSSET